MQRKVTCCACCALHLHTFLAVLCTPDKQATPHVEACPVICRSKFSFWHRSFLSNIFDLLCPQMKSATPPTERLACPWHVHPAVTMHCVNKSAAHAKLSGVYFYSCLQSTTPEAFPSQMLPSPFGIAHQIPRAHSAYVPSRTHVFADSSLLTAESAPQNLKIRALGLGAGLIEDDQAGASPNKAGRLQHLKMRVAVSQHAALMHGTAAL